MLFLVFSQDGDRSEMEDINDLMDEALESDESTVLPKSLTYKSPQKVSMKNITLMVRVIFGILLRKDFGIF